MSHSKLARRARWDSSIRTRIETKRMGYNNATTYEARWDSSIRTRIETNLQASHRIIKGANPLGLFHQNKD